MKNGKWDHAGFDVWGDPLILKDFIFISLKNEKLLTYTIQNNITYNNIFSFSLQQNRISAQRFRQKKKNEYEQLKDSLTLMEQENVKLKQKVD